ncbi:DUF6919 domain-containing protein [Prauserella marina]|uniref:DUF6919 domain-containing protein n=1 Tax=Prauserella marina TaxID=530584 RepID=UPI003B848733
MLTARHEPQLGYNGRPWSQRAAVDRLVDADTSEDLVNSANAAGLVVIHYAEPRRPFRPRGAWVDVTRYRADDHWVVTTGFGTHLSRRDLRFHFMECHRTAIHALYRAHQVTVLASDYGADSTVRDVLQHWADTHA